MLSEQAQAEIGKLQTQYPDPRSALMPALYVAQREYGWLPDEAIKQVADLFGMTATEVGSVASFYTMYFREKIGRHVVDFCTDLPCALVGAEEAYKRWRGRLGLQDGQVTTADGAMTVRPAMCLGGCDRAPLLLLDNEKQYLNLTDEQLDQLAQELRK
jgi:NADH-quinone oxidoreductase subunit E